MPCCYAGYAVTLVMLANGTKKIENENNDDVDRNNRTQKATKELEEPFFHVYVWSDGGSRSQAILCSAAAAAASPATLSSTPYPTSPNNSLGMPFLFWVLSSLSRPPFPLPSFTFASRFSVLGVAYARSPRASCVCLTALLSGDVQ